MFLVRCESGCVYEYTTENEAEKIMKGLGGTFCIVDHLPTEDEIDSICMCD